LRQALLMILGVLQARVSSTRLPGKVLKPILGEPMILRQIERLLRSRRIDRLVLATSADPQDDPLATAVGATGMEVHRGSLDDVLDRFIGAASPYKPEWIVRLTGDCPLADPELIDQVIEATLSAAADYGSNTLEPTYPDGLDVEVVRYAALEEVWRAGGSPAEREHVTLGIHRHPERFRLLGIKAARDLSRLRWTVDEARDFAFVERVYAALYPANPSFGTADILALLDRHPELATLNAGIARNEGLAKSLAAERS
jgi:spore coat polysaccharide biosynthesis protein SpsF